MTNSSNIIPRDQTYKKKENFKFNFKIRILLILQEAWEMCSSIIRDRQYIWWISNIFEHINTIIHIVAKASWITVFQSFFFVSLSGANVIWLWQINTIKRLHVRFLSKKKKNVGFFLSSMLFLCSFISHTCANWVNNVNGNTFVWFHHKLFAKISKTAKI